MSAAWDVLVIDDEPVIRDAVRLVLGSEGFRVAEAETAGAALAHDALRDCRLVLCDMMLPNADGVELVREMRRRRPELAIVLITGYATAEHAARAIEAGASAFLAKPFDDVELMDLVRQVLPRTDAAREEGRP
jgi:DNA-binding NtrC family response regulator